MIRTTGVPLTDWGRGCTAYDAIFHRDEDASNNAWSTIVIEITTTVAGVRTKPSWEIASTALRVETTRHAEVATVCVVSSRAVCVLNWGYSDQRFTVLPPS